MWQFLVAVRAGASNDYQNLTNADGEVTSHIVGFLARSLKLMENGIMPVYVSNGAFLL